MRRTIGFGVLVILIVGGLLVGLWIRRNDQRPDPSFDATVAHPAYSASTANTVRVAIDKAHHNFHTADKRYAPFARLLGNDGYRVTPSDVSFDAPHALDSVNVLVVANAMGWWLPR